jgi:chemotaxis signal transduction protein
MVNLHGRVVPVYFLQELMGMPGRPPRISDMLIIVQSGGDAVALWIDETRGVGEHVPLSLNEAPGEVDRDLPHGITMISGGIVLFTDLSLFLTCPPDKAGLEMLFAIRAREDFSLRGIQDSTEPDTAVVTAIFKERAERMLPPEPGDIATEMTEILRFQLAYRQYAIEMKYVREVILTGEITPVPGTPEFISGICAARGQIISLVDLRNLLKIPEKGLTDLNRVIVMTDGKITFGILADTIGGAGAISLDRVLPPDPSDYPEHHRYVKGILDHEMVVLDAQAILGDPKIIIDDA